MTNSLGTDGLVERLRASAQRGREAEEANPNYRSLHADLLTEAASHIEALEAHVRTVEGELKASQGQPSGDGERAAPIEAERAAHPDWRLCCEPAEEMLAAAQRLDAFANHLQTYSAEQAIIYAYGLPSGGVVERHQMLVADIRSLLGASPASKDPLDTFAPHLERDT